MNSIRLSDTRKSQRGMVSIMVALVFIMVTLLIVTGFAQVARRNNRIALDNQLSSQALYAAESGVNDAINGIETMLAANITPTAQDECMPGGSSPYVVNGGNISDGVRYTCQLVNLAPPDLLYDAVNESSIIIPAHATSGNLNTLEMTWQQAPSAPTGSNATACNVAPGGANGNWPDVSAWPANCHYGVMRIDVLPVTPGTLQDATSAARSTATAFVAPQQSTGPPATFNYASGAGNRYTGASGSATQGQVLRASCDSDTCKVNITNLSFPMAYLRVSFLYRQSNLRIASPDPSQTFQNTQALIDVTGRAQDVLRRIQVRVPIGGTIGASPANGFSEYAIQSNEDICKRYFAAPLSLTQPSDGCSDSAAAGSGSGGSSTGASAIGIGCNVVVDSCPPGSGSSGSPSGTYEPYPANSYHFNVRMYNNATVPTGLSVVGCTWNFGNGATAVDQECNPGDTIRHDYALPGDSGQFATGVDCNRSSTTVTCTPTGTTYTFPQGCSGTPELPQVRRTYPAVLTVNFSNGTTQTSPIRYIALPVCG